MPNPGTFRGKRGAYLLAQAPFYKEAIKENKGSDAARKIIRSFFKRFPPEYPNSWEPTDEFLKSVDDDAIVEERVRPRREDFDSLAEEGEGEEELAKKREGDEGRYQAALSLFEEADAREKDLIPVRLP